MRVLSKILLALLISSLLVGAVSAGVNSPRPRIWNGYDLTPYLNVSTGLDAGDVLDVTGTFNASSWMTTTIGKITETLWMPYEFFVISLVIVISCLIGASLSPRIEFICALLALLFMTWIFITLPFVAYHGAETQMVIEAAKYDASGQTLRQPAQTIIVVQPWEELYLMQNGYSQIMTVLFFVTIFRFFLAMYRFMINLVRNTEPITNTDTRRIGL